jgi:RING finger protein 113A
MSEPGQKVPFFRKGKSRPATARKRSPSPSPSSSSSAPLSVASQVVLPAKKSFSNLLTAGTKRSLSQRDDHDDVDTPEKDGPDIKWSAENSHVNAALEILAGDEAEMLLAKRRKREKEIAGEEDDITPDDGLYHGQKAYQTHIKKSTEIPKSMRVGPQRTASTIRTVTIIDYQPDVCKDYKGVIHSYTKRI